MDDMTPEQRHRNMLKIRSTDTKAELMLRKALWSRGYRYRKNMKSLIGKPDIVLTKYKIVIFCDGEFFHGKDWESDLSKRLKRSNNSEYWIEKIQRNMERAREVELALHGEGWTVLRFWSKEILKDVDSCVKVIEEIIWENYVSNA